MAGPALLAVVLIGQGAQAATPARRPEPLVLTARTEVVGRRSASIDVRLDRDAVLDPRDFFDADPAHFDGPVGVGYALISLDRVFYPPTLVGVVAPQGTRARRLQFPFGDDGRGNEILVTGRLPAGRYRLYLLAPGNREVTVRFRLHGLANRTTRFRPTRPENVQSGVARGEPTSAVGTVLGDARNLTARSTLAIQTLAARLKPSPAGYESYWCLYRGDPPLGRYLHRCVGAAQGTGVGNRIPALDKDVSGYSAIVHLAPGRWATSRSLEAVGQIHDQTSQFFWIPMPHGMPRELGGDGAPLVAAADSLGNRLTSPRG